jgi:pyridoxamine 5'-phosphate oxidase
MSIADDRREYGLGGLDRQDLGPDPLQQFRGWMAHAEAQRGTSRLKSVGVALFKAWQALLGRPPIDLTAMVLATADARGEPSARTVLLKGIDARGFTFFTNYDSRKGRDLAENPKAALVFYWAHLERQVIVSGTVTKLPVEESEAYFQSRPRGSRIAALASPQSAVVGDRAALERLWAEAAARFPGDDVPLPDNWGGYVLSPTRVEFWQGRLNRLHDRFCYTLGSDGQWHIDRLAP